jgi:hypothetical protein
MRMSGTWLGAGCACARVQKTCITQMQTATSLMTAEYTVQLFQALTVAIQQRTWLQYHPCMCAANVYMPLSAKAHATACNRKQGDDND